MRVTANQRVQALLIGGFVVLVLLACKKNDPPPPPATTTTAVPVHTGPCPLGLSIDPNPGEFRPAVTAFKDQEYETAQKLLDTMMTKYPNSATVRVWRGDAALFDKKKSATGAADDALPFYEEALKLQDKGCKLPEYEHYYLRMGFSYAYLRKKDGASAKTHLDIAKKNWADSAEVFYNLARAECAEGNVDECADAFEECLKIAKALKRPKFLRNHNSLDDWIRRSRSQSEFPKLRANSRYREIIKNATSED